jgi:hypothetical protein
MNLKNRAKNQRGSQAQTKPEPGSKTAGSQPFRDIPPIFIWPDIF